MSSHSSWESRKLRYWAECSGQSRRAGLRTRHPAPAALLAQMRLDSRVLEQLGTTPDLCAHPFGIASLTGSGTSLTLHLDACMGQEQLMNADGGLEVHPAGVSSPTPLLL
ncbi:hypothetical protein ACFV8T_26330 [Streptomyces sp. NPDC059832]|uniref:hypothetical protein n=1 Tax=Streptomyces sp. NPDC059832 TaxID=3346966 RepID=UPI003647BAA9